MVILYRSKIMRILAEEYVADSMSEILGQRDDQSFLPQFVFTFCFHPNSPFFFTYLHSRGGFPASSVSPTATCFCRMCSFPLPCLIPTQIVYYLLLYTWYMSKRAPIYRVGKAIPTGTYITMCSLKYIFRRLSAIL
jgi:hypothetical protein